MKKTLSLVLLCLAMLAGVKVGTAQGDFYVVGVGRVGTQISSVPYTISSPGLYCLAGNLTFNPVNGNAITINASDVTLDLMGFCLTGPGKLSAQTNNGILIQQNSCNVEIRNGSINDFGFYGIFASDCFNIRVLGIRLRDTGGTAIALPSGVDHVVTDCNVRNAGAYGIQAEGSCIVRGNRVVNSFGHGILAGSFATVADNLVKSNFGRGIQTGNYSTIIGNTSGNNTDVGIHTGTYCTIVNNTTGGLTSGADCTLDNNTVY
jgi:hypothetical protein